MQNNRYTRNYYHNFVFVFVLNNKIVLVGVFRHHVNNNIIICIGGDEYAFAEPASSVRCPLHGPAYYFAYNDLVHGTCPQALSYAQPCAGHSKYQLRFNHCVPGATFNNRGLCTDRKSL